MILFLIVFQRTFSTFTSGNGFEWGRNAFFTPSAKFAVINCCLLVHIIPKAMSTQHSKICVKFPDHVIKSLNAVPCNTIYFQCNVLHIKKNICATGLNRLINTYSHPFQSFYLPIRLTGKPAALHIHAAIQSASHIVVSGSWDLGRHVQVEDSDKTSTTSLLCSRWTYTNKKQAISKSKQTGKGNWGEQL